MTDLDTRSPLPNKTTRFVPRMYLFDVDGPIVNPKTETITQPHIIVKIVQELQAQRPVALITGRGTTWLIETVVQSIEKLVINPSELKNLFISAEFGGASITYADGSRHIHTDPNITIPADLLAYCEELIKTKYSDTMAFEKKETQFTAKVLPAKELDENGFAFSHFKEAQLNLVEEIQDYLEKIGLSDQFEVHTDRIATNVRDKSVNKVFATEHVLAWLAEKGVEPKSFIIFADSRGDFEIADAVVDNELVQEKNYPVKVIYLGHKEEITDLIKAAEDYEIDVRTHDDLTQGTADFLHEQSL